MIMILADATKYKYLCWNSPQEESSAPLKIFRVQNFFLLETPRHYNLKTCNINIQRFTCAAGFPSTWFSTASTAWPTVTSSTRWMKYCCNSPTFWFSPCVWTEEFSRWFGKWCLSVATACVRKENKCSQQVKIIVFFNYFWYKMLQITGFETETWCTESHMVFPLL